MSSPAFDLPRFRTPAPELPGEILPPFAFDNDGNAEVAGLALRRTVAAGPDGAMAVTLRLTNRRTAPVRLRRLIPAEWRLPELFPGRPADALRIWRLARQKNDFPGPFTPGRDDENTRLAAFDSSEVTAGYGIGGEARAGGPPSRFHADPGLAAETGDGFLFIGFAGQTRHLNDVVLSAAAGTLSAQAEFDDILLQPGEARETHPLVIERGPALRALLDRHADRIAATAGSRRGAPREIFCSWYYYGAEIDAEEMRRNLTFLRQNPTGFKVFQLDMGWHGHFGDWQADEARFPDGMAAMAAEIRDAGFLPGIWTAPLVIEPGSAAARDYPDILLRNRQGELCTFACARGACYILDPFAPRAEAFLGELFGRLADWGYTYHKLDFVRAVFLHADARFHDETRTRAEACRRALELIRRAAGEKAVLDVCGGLFEGSAGIADLVRSGADVRGFWSDGNPLSDYALRIRQNVLRNFYAPLWTVDPDALQLRRNDVPWRGNLKHHHLSCGRFSDEEAFSIVVNQFLGGGASCVSERLPELDRDRFDLYRRVIPAFGDAAWFFGDWDGVLPERFVTFCRSEVLPPWCVVTLANWNRKETQLLPFRPAEVPNLPEAPEYALFELKESRFLGIFSPDDRLELAVPGHGARLLRLTPLEAAGRQVVGTDRSLSGGLEIAAFDPETAAAQCHAGAEGNAFVLDRDDGDRQLRIEMKS